MFLPFLEKEYTDISRIQNFSLAEIPCAEIFVRKAKFYMQCAKAVTYKTMSVWQKNWIYILIWVDTLQIVLYIYIYIYGLCFWASHPLIDKFYKNLAI